MFVLQIGLSTYLITQLFLVVTCMFGRSGSFKEVEIALGILCAVAAWLILPAFTLGLLHASSGAIVRYAVLLMSTLLCLPVDKVDRV